MRIDAQYKFIVKASEYCSTIIIHARTFKQWHSWEVDRETLYQLRKDMNPSCFLIGNGWITSYEKTQQAATISDWQWAEIGIMIGQAAIGNPRIFTPHHPTNKKGYKHVLITSISWQHMKSILIILAFLFLKKAIN